MKSTQNLSPGRFRHAEAESEVKNLPIRHPDLEMKENDLQNLFLNPFTGFYLFRRTYGFLDLPVHLRTADVAADICATVSVFQS